MKSLTFTLTGDPDKVEKLIARVRSAADLADYNLALKIEDTGFSGSDYTRLPAELYDRKGSSLPDIIVLDERLSITNPEIESAARNLNLNLPDNEQGFIGDINHKTYQRLVSAIGHFPLAPLYFNKFLRLLTLGANGEVKVYDGDGKEKHIDLVRKIKDDILGIRNPWRAERLGGQFEANSITYQKICLEDGKAVIKEVTEKLEDCLMENCFVDIKDWLTNPTPQGLVRAKTPVTKTEEFKFWHPRDGFVPWFGANSHRVNFFCGGHPGDSDSSLGGRAAKISSGN